MTSAAQPPHAFRVAFDPFFLLSALIAVAYGIWAPGLFAQPDPPLPWLAVFKAAPVFILSARALLAQSRLLSLGLLFGCVGDALLVWHETFLAGALAFLIGHIFYISLFLRAGIGVGATFRQPPRIIAALVLIAASILMTTLLVPAENLATLGVYTGVLTLMALTSFTLPWSRWLVMTGAVLFFISDGFVAWNMFHHDPDPTLAFWRSFAGWMIYWAGQAAICYGALGLHRAK
ncbi:lysoplasmalogenase family protein [Terricaulis sp.]|uniref:lysoplasmalogenase family protein n=1 Tax=Terricaulis sp. TaxID=2768686 RepID=UPI0037839DF3